MQSVKYIVIGNSGAGKSSIINQYVYKSFNRVIDSTIGADIKIKTVELNNGDKMKINIWDLAGQERFRSIVKSYYRNCHGVLLVFDLNDLHSFKSLDYWYSELSYIYDVNKMPVIYLIGNKSDIKSIDYSLIDEFLEGKNIKKYVECSAMSTDDIKQLFNELNNDVYDNCNDYAKMDVISLEDSKKNSCC